MIGETILDKSIEGTIIGIDQIMEETRNRDIEIEVKAGRILEIIIVTIQEKEVEIEIEIGVMTDKHDHEQEHYLMKEETGPGLDPILE